MKHMRFSLLLLILVVFYACSRHEKINLNSISIDQNFYRFEQDLFSIPLDSIWDFVPKLEKKYSDFFTIFNREIISIGSISQFDYDDKLKYFLTDPDITAVYEQSQKIFEELFFKKEIEKSFKRFHFYFPNKVIPDIYTHISGFNQSIIIDSTYISISLDKYLGANSKYYQMLRLPLYQQQNMNALKIPSDVLMSHILTEFENNSNNLLDEMIYYGKVHFLLKEIMPNQPDSLLWGYTEKKLKWCRSNERQMWMYLVENKLLFSSSQKDVIRFIDDGPFTNLFSKQSPARTGRWIGYNIVKEYMSDNPKVSIKELMQESDAQKILNRSKYRP